jgi:hypothetical protein
MRFSLKRKSEGQSKDQHRLTIIGGQHRGPEEGELFRVDIPVEVQHDEWGENLVIPDNAWRSYTDGEPVKIDYIEVRMRSTPGHA